MSQYPKTFIQPLVTKEEQESLKETNEFQNFSHVPVRAALNFQTASPFYDKLLEKFICIVMEMGKKELARGLIEKGFVNIKRIQLERYHLADEEEKPTIELNPRQLFQQAIENCRPVLKLIPIKRGGTIYQVPVPVNTKNSYFLSMKWLIEATNNKPANVLFPERFAWEILDAAANTGRVVKRKQDLHKQCEANRAYAHYRWR